MRAMGALCFPAAWHGCGMRIAAGIFCWLIFITWLHGQRQNTGEGAALRVGFLPITCHLLCPVAAFRHGEDAPPFRPVKYSSWPDMIESLRGGRIDMAFILAPIAIALGAQEEPVRIALLGHRDGTALVLRNSDDIAGIKDLMGKRIAIPIRYSSQYLALLSLLEQNGLGKNDVDIAELPPPDMPSAMAAGEIDAYIVGEPYAAKAETEGIGRIACLMKDAFPGFISSVLVVREEILRERRAEAASLIRRFHSEAAWIEANRDEAARIGADAYGLPVSLLTHVLSTPPDRVSYARLVPDPGEIAAIGKAMKRQGLIDKVPDPAELVDTFWIATDEAGH